MTANLPDSAPAPRIDWLYVACCVLVMALAFLAYAMTPGGTQ